MTETIAPKVIDQEGGCACRAIRYRVRGPASCETLCHCTDCRLAAGAPSMAWATFPTSAVEWLSGTLKKRRSSERALRGFCGDCGTQLTYHVIKEPELIDLTIATFDDPNILPPKDHLFVRSKPTWISIADGLPRYDARRDS